MGIFSETVCVDHFRMQYTSNTSGSYFFRVASGIITYELQGTGLLKINFLGSWSVKYLGLRYTVTFPGTREEVM